MEIRRHNDIIAFRQTSISENSEVDSDLQSTKSNDKPSDKIVAFHARNMEIAAVSPEMFNLMSPIDLSTGTIPSESLDFLESSDVARELSSWEKDVNTQVKSGHLDFGIRTITLNVTQICNLKCHYCAAGGDGTYGDPVARLSIEKTLPQMKYLIEKRPPGSRFHISFVGGEPFLYPDALNAIYDYTLEVGRACGVEVGHTITTNGTLFTDSVIEMLSNMKVHITISLDGAAAINDVVRPAKDGRSSTALTVSGMKKLESIRQHLLSVGISGVFSSENSDLISAYQFFNTLNPDWLEFNFAYAETSAAFQDSYLKQMDQIALDLWKQNGEESLRKLKTFDLYFKLLDNQQRVENHCGSGKSYLMVDARNQMYPCVWSVGDKSELVGVGAYLRPELMSELSKPLIELNNCQTCWARYLCGGGCMYVNKIHSAKDGKPGNKHQKSDLFCERTRHLILTTFMYYKLSRDMLMGSKQ